MLLFKHLNILDILSGYFSDITHCLFGYLDTYYFLIAYFVTVKKLDNHIIY